MISENEAYQRQLGGCTAVPNGDELRRIAHSARTSASDDASPTEYVLAGWKAATRAAPKSAPGEPLTVSPLEEQQMFDDWCPYKGNPDPRTVWAAAIEAVNGLLLGVAAPQQEAQEPVVAAVFDEQLGRPMLVEGAPMLRHGQLLYTAPQPAPAPLSDDVVKDAARYRWLIDQHWIQTEVEWRLISTDQDLTIKQLDAAIDAALAAQGENT